MATVNTYLNFNGNTEEAFNFYKSVFGGEFLTVQRFKDSPGCEGMKISDQEKLMHIALPIGGNILMGTDITEPMPPATFGTGISLSVDASSEEEAYKLFNDLAEGGKATMPLDKMFWGALFGMLTDKFGIQWMVNYDYNI
ncbi:VOC family protein [Pedobacter rhodius]|uniref:VOC family protein n=1 Tax=Pedobacter rhodius TaxID=3004098 RepID=A0ABT4KXB4_9SPHI|nr:VOC family protein [Pedobacter sp. SJ11]MCZ4223366.1 VOC family protein [Pedobacter sp. SJ11]